MLYHRDRFYFDLIFRHFLAPLKVKYQSSLGPKKGSKRVRSDVFGPPKSEIPIAEIVFYFLKNGEKEEKMTKNEDKIKPIHDGTIYISLYF